jgi:hypothetical protein
MGKVLVPLIGGAFIDKQDVRMNVADLGFEPRMTRNIRNWGF